MLPGWSSGSTTPMPIDRRTFLAGSLGHAFLLSQGVHARTPGLAFVTTGRDRESRYHAVLLSAKGAPLTRHRLPGRGHDAVAHPSGREWVVFARSPGRFAVAFGSESGRPPTWFETKQDRHFYGHGTFSADGRLLYATENDYEMGEGRVSVRDVTSGYRQIGEFPSYGVGPHDLVSLDEGGVLCVANGGVATHPASGEKILNPMTMAPSLVFIDSRTGALLERQDLGTAFSRLSIRHLAAADKDTIVFACQNRGDRRAEPPLVGRAAIGRTPRLFRAGTEPLRAMRGYIASIAVDRSGEIAAASAPRGGRITYWDVSSGRYLGHTVLEDGAGVAPTAAAGRFLLTGGRGDLLSAGPSEEGNPLDGSRSALGLAWDNHAIRAW